jgi:hypothetical protein
MPFGVLRPVFVSFQTDMTKKLGFLYNFQRIDAGFSKRLISK